MTRPVESRLADELAIRALVARYCHSIAERDDKAWAESWCAEAEWKVLGQSVRGRAEILAHYQRLIAGCRFVQQVATDGLVEIEGDTARGKWQIAETILPKAGAAAINLGSYADRYQRDADGAWRFARREFRGHYLGPADLSAAARPPAGWGREP